MPVTGYPSATSVAQGEAVRIHLSVAPAQNVGIAVSRVGASVVERWRGSASAAPLAVPQGGAQAGYGWPVAAEIPVGTDWPSGLYRVSLSAADGGHEDFHIAVRAAAPGSQAPVLLMYPATTGHAYNATGGASLYEFNSPGGVAADRVSFDRPGGLEYGSELPFAAWFDAAGIPTEACSSVDLHEQPGLAGAYRLVVSMGHDEYWSREMRDALEDYVSRGGNVAFFSGNVCWWQVRFEQRGRVMICHKDAASDPLAGLDDSRVTVNWADFPVCRPENALTGVGWRRGSQVAQNGAYTCRFPEHWALEGTGLVEGDEFGAGFVGYETDACEFEEQDGRPRATGADGTPPSFVIIATADFTQPIHPAPGRATMGAFRRGGTVFAGASIGWGAGLAAGDRHLDRITHNVVARLSAPQVGKTWEPIGEAIDVTGMAAQGGRLFAATADGQLWLREATAQNLHWTQIGEAGRVIALAANGYAKRDQHQPLYGIDGAGQVLRRQIEPLSDWAPFESVNGSAALAVNNSDVLHGVDDAGTLWVRDPAPDPPATARWVSEGPVGFGVRALAAQYRSLIACDDAGRLWGRAVAQHGVLQGDWRQLTEALEEVLAIAATEGSVYAATASGALWRHDLASPATEAPAIRNLTTLTVPARVIGDSQGLGKVRLDGPAGADGVEVALASASPSRIAVPASVVVAESAVEAEFDLGGGSQYGTAAIRATLNNRTIQRVVIHQREPLG